MTVPPTTMRTTRCAPRLATFGPLRVTLPVQLPFRLVSPLSSLPRARKSSTTRRFYERDRPSAYARTTWPSRCVVRDRTPARTPTPPHLDVPHMGPSHPTFPMVPLGMSTAHGCYHSQKIAGEDEVDPAAPAPLALAVDEPRDQADQVGCAPARLSPVRRRVAPLVIHLKNDELRRSLN